MAKVNETFRIDGVDLLKQIFDELPKAVATRVTRKVLYQGAIPIRDAARAKVPVRDGALKKAIIVQTGQELADAGIGTRVSASGHSVEYTKFRRTGNLKAYVTIAKKYYIQTTTKSGKTRVRALKKNENYKSVSQRRIYPRRYAHLVEFGTAPHHVGAGSTRRGRSVKGTAGILKVRQKSGAMHPGARPKPFMRPAFDEQTQSSIRIMTAAARAEIDKELEKIKRKAKR